LNFSESEETGNIGECEFNFFEGRVDQFERGEFQYYHASYSVVVIIQREA
jgi:hypothetical protein